MSPAEVWSELPKEPLVYEAGGVIFASALLGFAHVSKRLLGLIGHRGAWVLPAAGAGLMFLAVGLHAWANDVVMFSSDLNTTEGLLAVYRFRFIALLAMLASSGVTLAGALLLWFWLTGARASAEARPATAAPPAGPAVPPPAAS